MPEPYRRADRGDIYWFTYTDRDGKRKLKSTGKTTKRDARDFITKWIAKHGSSVHLTFRQYADDYFVAGQCPREARLKLDGRNFGATHMEKSRRWLLLVFKDRFSDLPLSEIRRRDVLDLRTRLVAKYPGKLNTVGKCIETVKTVLSEAEFRQDIDSNPARGVSPPRFDRKPRGVFTIEEVTAILGAMPDLVATDKAKTPENGRRPRVVALFTALFLTGMRLGEIQAWRWEDIDGDRFRVVRAVKDRHGTIGDPKWDKRREGLAMPRMLIDAMNVWKRHCPYDGYVFPSIDGDPVSTTVIRKAWARLIKHATDRGILPKDDRWLTPHSARHTLNTHLLAARVPPLDVQLYLGWQSPAGKMLTRVQEGYTSVRLLDTSTVAEAVDRMYNAKEITTRTRREGKRAAPGD